MKIFQSIFELISPKFSVGGLAINESEIQYVMLKRSSAMKYRVPLPDGTVKEGKIANVDALREALKKLHNQISKRKKTYVIANIPDHNVYAQVFNIPLSATEHMEEAAQLNLQMISPIEFESAYTGWEKLDENKIGGGQWEILGAFVHKEIVEAYLNILKETNFVVVAVESPAFAVTRVAAQLKANDLKEDYLLIRIQESGIGFNIMRKGKFYFNHFVSWQSKYGDARTVTFADFKDTLRTEVQRVVKFYETHWPGQIKNALFASHGIQEELVQFLKDEFSFSVQLLRLKEYKDLGVEWYSALGSGLRGVIPRSKDAIISLTSVDTQEEFLQYYTLSIVRLFRAIVVSLLGVTLAAFIAVDFFLIETYGSTQKQLDALTNAPTFANVQELQQEARIFNEKLEIIARAREQSMPWYISLPEEIRGFAGSQVVVDRVFVQSREAPVIVRARADDDTQMLAFKTKLQDQAWSSKVELPLSEVETSPTGVLTFNITFTLANLDF